MPLLKRLVSWFAGLFGTARVAPAAPPASGVTPPPSGVPPAPIQKALSPPSTDAIPQLAPVPAPSPEPEPELDAPPSSGDAYDEAPVDDAGDAAGEAEAPFGSGAIDLADPAALAALLEGRLVRAGDGYLYTLEGLLPPDPERVLLVDSALVWIVLREQLGEVEAERRIRDTLAIVAQGRDPDASLPDPELIDLSQQADLVAVYEGSPEDMRLDDLIEISTAVLHEIGGEDPEARALLEQVADLMAPDIEAVFEALGWVPQRDLEDDKSGRLGAP